jgi:hypothetical protein
MITALDFSLPLTGKSLKIDDDLSVCVRDDGFYGIGSGSRLLQAHYTQEQHRAKR